MVFYTVQISRRDYVESLRNIIEATTINLLQWLLWSAHL